MPRKIESGWEINQEEQELLEIKRAKTRAQSLGWNAYIMSEGKNSNPYEPESELYEYWEAGYASALSQYGEMRAIVGSLHLLGDGVNPTTHFAEPKKRGRPRIHPKVERDPNKPKRKYTKRIREAA